jgi:transcriptional regulator with XRE-family HTH domain
MSKKRKQSNRQRAYVAHGVEMVTIIGELLLIEKANDRGSVRAIAEDVGCSTSTLYNYMEKRTAPRLPNYGIIAGLCEYWGVELSKPMHALLPKRR